MSPYLLGVVAAGFATGCAAIARALWGPHAKARQRLSSGCAELADRAIVTLTGTVRVPGDALTAPLSRHPCVMFTTVMHLHDWEGNRRVEVAHVVEHEMIDFDLEIDGQIVRVSGEQPALTELAIEPRALIPRIIERERVLLDKDEHDRALLRNDHPLTIGIAR